MPERIPILLVLLLAWPGYAALRAQDTGTDAPAAQDESQQVEESDEAFRRRMELEDARYRDPTYVDPQGGYKRELEKIDRLPEASRDNIREQLIDLIMESGEWTPEDAGKTYPYRPSAAAGDDPALAREEQEAWDEQIEKYHAREAAAFGARRGPVSGPGNPDGAEGGGQQGEPGEQGQSGQAGSAGAAGQAGAAAGTYQPNATRRTGEDRPSTAGVSESALDFILGRQGQGAAPRDPAPGEDAATEAAAEAAAANAATDDATADPAPRDLRGLLAIEDLDKLGEGVGAPPPPEEEPEPEKPKPDGGR